VRRRTELHDKAMEFLRAKGVHDRGEKTANFAVLRLTDMPAVLTENLFIDTAAAREATQERRRSPRLGPRVRQGGSGPRWRCLAVNDAGGL
jgi:N-acetylmuramoyl-L-alanine amidase